MREKDRERLDGVYDYMTGRGGGRRKGESYRRRMYMYVHTYREFKMQQEMHQ